MSVRPERHGRRKPNSVVGTSDPDWGFPTLTEVFSTLTEVFPSFFLSYRANAKI